MESREEHPIINALLQDPDDAERCSGGEGVNNLGNPPIRISVLRQEQYVPDAMHQPHGNRRNKASTDQTRVPDGLGMG
jgi:hypothetical protein